jgi:hypothetical protein
MDQNKWADFYKKLSRTEKKKVWIKIRFTDGQQVYFNNHREWLNIKDFCQKKSVFISNLELQFKSNLVKIDLDGAEGLYFVPSVMGQIGKSSKNYLTVGVLKNDLVHKDMWLVPELIVEKSMTDPLSRCFEEAIIYDEKAQENREEQV